MDVFFSAVLPTTIVFLIGYVLQRIRFLDVKSISTMAIYIFLPALVFKNLYESTFDQQFMTLFLFALFLLIVLITLNKILATLFGWSKATESASMLASVFMNAGNYGAPIIYFGLGEEAFPYAIFFMVVQSLLMNSFGVYYASRGKRSIGQAVLTIFKMPATYAAIFAFLFQKGQIELSDTTYSMISLLADGSIPVMMVVLGMQLASIKGLEMNWQVVSTSVLLKMIVSPTLAFLFVHIFSVEPLLGSVMIIISAMPTAVTTTLFAVEFDAEPNLVSTITLITTIMSVVTLTVLLNLL
ncbi:MAG TPA: AEC family transporter [Cerasibacillus sp.]|uniref:AEC family transporter n=1 Tax=Cerasibacillus sp. TaxID=2498711 RepID=UPI002F41BF0F